MTATPMRVIVADDEPAARTRIMRLLSGRTDAAVVAVCATGGATLAAVQALKPDLLLLDIEMPGLDGFDVVRSLDRASLPLVVFVTAHDRYALRAFEVHALDYLLKPFDDARLDQAVAWARAHLGRRELEAVRDRLTHLVRAAAADQVHPHGGGRSQRVALKCDGTIRFVPSGAITHITAEGCYARVHAGSHSFLIRESLSSMGARLPRSVFARVHRSTIVNLDGVVLVEPLTHGDARLTLANGVAVKVSRKFRRSLASLTEAVPAISPA